jgi:hypothetical protein
MQAEERAEAVREIETAVSISELTEAQKRLTEPQLRGLLALLSGLKQVEAAGVARVTPQTIRNWHRLPEFREALSEGREAMLREATTTLHTHTLWAVERLKQLAQEEKAGGYAQVAAARALFELTVKAAIAEDQSAQLAAIKRQLEELERRR